MCSKSVRGTSKPSRFRLSLPGLGLRTCLTYVKASPIGASMRFTTNCQLCDSRVR